MTDFTLAQKELDCFEQELAESGLPTEQPAGVAQGVLHVHPSRIVSSRVAATAPLGFIMCGGILSMSEEFYL